MLRVPYALSVYDDNEIQAIVQVLREHRTNMGKETRKFEKKVAALFGKKYGVMVNSGSSANLLAIEILKLPPKSEIITTALTFSTTIAPILQKGLVPVFVDILPGKYIINTDQVENLVSPRTKALMIPLLLGNVPDMEKLQKIAKKNNLTFIEDSCDTLGATFKGKPTGMFSDITTTSFFGSHVITAAGNGGMILMNKADWRDKAKVLRGWGRSSSVFKESESIEKRFQKKIMGVEYDAKFIFEEIGYNFLPSEIGSAFGNEQLKKLNRFKKNREKNFRNLKEFFKQYEKFFISPIEDINVSTQWLAFPLTITKTAPFKRIELVKYLEKANIQTRPIFTGNVLKQPGFKNIASVNNSKGYPVAEEIMKRGFLIGCHQGIKQEHLKLIKKVFKKFLEKYQ